MKNIKEALWVRAELELWSVRKAMHQPRVQMLKSKYILEQDDVNQLQRGIFSKLKRNYSEKLEKEQAEMNAAKVEWDKITLLMQMADEKLPELERLAEEHAASWEAMNTADLIGDEKDLLRWCEQMEQGKLVVMETNACIDLAKHAMQSVPGSVLEESPLPVLQKRAEMLHTMADRFYITMNLDERLPSWESMLFYLYTVQSLEGRYARNSVEDIQLAVASNNALFDLDKALKELREKLVELLTALEEEGETLLQKMGRGESHFCDKDAMDIQTMPEKEEKIDTDKISVFEGIGLFENVDLSREKERLLLGLELLCKEFKRFDTKVEKNFLREKSSG